MAGAYLYSSIQRDFTPVVMVLSTDKAEATCQRNGLSFVDLIRPFSVLQQINVPVRTASEQPYRIQDFQLRIFHASEIRQPSADAAEEYLAQIVSSSSEAAAAELKGDPKDLNTVLSMANSDPPGHWYRRYFRELARALAFSEHEAVDHPVACLLVVPSSAEDPINTFVDLYNTEQLPPLFNEQLMDPKIVKHFVLLHDGQTGDLARAETILASMRGTFGADACRLLQINTGRWPGTPPPPDVWSAHRLPRIGAPPKQNPPGKTGPPKEQPLGGELSNEDIGGLRDFVADLAVKQIIPQMEQKIRALNHTVSATRKGLKNQLKNFWFSGVKRQDSLEVSRTEDGQYPHTSTEAQIRLLGDLAFMLRDYELALSNYRLLAGDFRGDKAWKHLAGTLEMTGLCMFMLNQAPREAESSLEGAYQAYIRSGTGGLRFATRAVYWLGEIYKARGMFREAAAVLVRTSQEEQNLRAAMLLEQSALCYLRSAPPMWRKFGFNMVLAGHRYNQGLQRAHAQRAYQCVLGVYEGRGWAYISDHVHFALGRISAHLNDFHAAAAYFSHLLTCAHQSPAAQATFLREFLYVVQAVDLGVPLSLDLPTVHIDSYRVHFEDHRTYSSQAAAEVPERVWTSLEEGLVPTTNVVMQTWMDRPARGAHKDTPVPTNTCCVDEDITVDVEFSNPLQLELNISCARLVCEWGPDSGAKNAPIPRTSSVPAMDDRTSDSGGSSPADAVPPPLNRHRGHDPRVSSTGSLFNHDGLLTSPDAPARRPEDLQTRDDVAVGTRDASLEDGDADEDDSVAPGEAYRVVEEVFTLRGGERTVVRMTVRPLRGGVLRVVGVEWVLNNIAQGRKDFPVRVPKKKRKGGRPDKEYPPHTRLGFKVIGKMPKLQVTMHQLPETLHHGELRRLVLELSNAGTVPLEKLKLRTSHPAFFCMGLQGDLEGEFPACLEEGGARPTPGPDAGTSRTNYTFVFPQTTVLEGGSTLLWPLWLHARDVGTLQFHTLLYYEPGPPGPVMKYRTARVTSSIHVAPSLAVGVKLTLSPARLDRHLLWLDVENKHAQETFTLRQVSCAGAHWRLSPLQSPGGSRLATLAPSQATSLLFHIEASAESRSPGEPSGKSASEDGQFKSTVRLDSAETGGAIDVSSGPLLRFHARERWLQSDTAAVGSKPQPRRSSVDPPGPVPESSPLDVILVWEQQERRKSISAVEDPARIGSFHICHQSLKGLSPVRWLLTGPPSPVLASFASSPLVEIPLSLRVRNCAPALATVRIEVLDPSSEPSKSDPGGWFCPPILPSPSSTGDVVSTLGASGSPAAGGDPPTEDQPCGTTPCPPYIWSGTTSRVVEDLRPGDEAAVSLSAAVFAPGVYDVTKYRVSWTLKPLPPTTEEVTPGADAARPSGLPPRPKSATPAAKAQSSASGTQARGGADRWGADAGQNLGAGSLGGFEKEGSGLGQTWLLVVKEDSSASQPPELSRQQTPVSSPENLLDI